MRNTVELFSFQKRIFDDSKIYLYLTAGFVLTDNIELWYGVIRNEVLILN